MHVPCQWLFSQGEVEQGICSTGCGLQSLKQLLPGPLQEKKKKA